MSRLSLATAGVVTLILSACWGSQAHAVNASRAAHVRGGHVRIHALTITAPLALGRYYLRDGGPGRAGRRPPVTGVLLTDDPSAHRRRGGFSKWSNPSSKGPPANKVALLLQQWLAEGPALPQSAFRLHLPLTLHQRWFREHLENGHRGYRWGYLMVRGQPYQVMYWSGRAAPARDRAAALKALSSIHRGR